MSSLKIVELTENNTCKICENAVGKYSCPRCNIIYCSLTCYQSEKHVECSELFYKDCVLENMDKNDEASKTKMMEVLQRFHELNKLEEEEEESEDDDDEEEEDEDDSYELDSDDDDFSQLYKKIGERLAGIDLDDSEEVWNRLNDDERQEFEQFLMSGDVSKFITMWRPWWEYRCDKKLIEVSELDEQKAKCPKILETIKPFSEISTKPPAMCVQHNMINLIAAYAFTLRYFNGDHFVFSKETSSFIFHLSLNLKKDQNFDSFNQAVNSITMECTSGELQISIDEENLEYIKSDVHMILSGPHATERKYYLLSGLSDIQGLFNQALSAYDAPVQQGNFFKKFTETQHLMLITKDQIKKSIKKIDYFLSFAKYCYDV